MKTSSYKDLIVWQRSFELVTFVYKFTGAFPSSEKYGLSQQIQRAAVSIPSNIAEGYGRRHRKEYYQFLSIAYGSLLELETQYLLSLELKYSINSKEIENHIKEVGSMLYCMLNPR